MNDKEAIDIFREIVKNKYTIYNSLFLNLPNDTTADTGIFIPLLNKLSREGYDQSAQPKEIIETFFAKHTNIKDNDARLDFLFRILQYIERQVLLFDSIEDAAFSSFQNLNLNTIIGNQPTDLENWTKHFKNFSARLVFTAHPTQFYSEDVQSILRELRKAIKKDSITQIDSLLQQLSFTPFVKREKPTPYEEAKNILYYLQYVYYDTMGTIYHDIGKLINQSPDFNPHLIEMGFWPGGDRDGNPFVTAETTFQVAQKLRNTVMKCYYNHVKTLRRKLTFKEVAEPMEYLKDKLYKQTYSKEVVISDVEIISILKEIKTKVKANYQSLYDSDIDDFMGRVHLFGNHFATLDVRQDSRKHLAAIVQIFEKEFGIDYLKLDDNQKINYLTQKSLHINPENYEDELTRDTLKNVCQIKEIQKTNGERGLNRYIISNSENIFDVLHVFALFKYCNYSSEEINIDIVPLFETLEGMRNSKLVMETLYQNEVYKQHLKHRNQSQTVMLGFSDGTKDAGYLKANWEIYVTKETLTEVSKTAGYQVVFFDGRGGPPARGGGKTHQFYAAQGKNISNDKIQLTIQGQTITSVYGTNEQATYNIEQLLMAGAKHKQSDYTFPKPQRDVMEDLANLSFQKYKALKEDALFVPYLEDMTTLKYYGASNIGSRPSKRNSADKLNLNDLRAIPFVGAWSLIRQNVPGYYGLGTALSLYGDKFHEVEQLYQDSAFFRSLILNSIMSMKKTFFPLTEYMQEDKVYGKFWTNLREEFELTKKWVLLLTQQQELMENEPLSNLSVSMRGEIVLPLLTIQQYALQKIKEEDKDKSTYEKLVVRSLFGNINANRNSA